jgi:hypothetical protein
MMMAFARLPCRCICLLRRLGSCLVFLFGAALPNEPVTGWAMLHSCDMQDVVIICVSHKQALLPDELLHSSIKM